MAPGLPPSSALGFGCGAVGGRVGRKQSAWALSAALYAGITHFDVARSYGYGDAEILLGEVLVGRRERVVIATKLGITASSAARILKSLKPLAQKAVWLLSGVPPTSEVPRLRPRARDIRRFSPAVARASLDESLRALKTDYVDILFLHECSPFPTSTTRCWIICWLSGKQDASAPTAWRVELRSRPLSPSSMGAEYSTSSRTRSRTVTST